MITREEYIERNRAEYVKLRYWEDGDDEFTVRIREMKDVICIPLAIGAYLLFDEKTKTGTLLRADLVLEVRYTPKAIETAMKSGQFSYEQMVQQIDMFNASQTGKRPP